MLHVRDNDQWSACCWKRWLQRGLPLCESSSAAVVHSYPQAALTHTRTDAYSILPHMSICISLLTPTHTYTRSRTGTHTYISISQTVKSKAQQWTNRVTEGPRTTVITLPHDSIQWICPVTSKHALFHQAPEKHVCHVALWGLCVPQLAGPCIIIQHLNGYHSSYGKSSPGSDLNMTAGTYHRIFESKAGESRA